MERVEGFDIARGVGVVMVVVFHASFLSHGGMSAEQPVSRMGLLLLISGVLSAPMLKRGRRHAATRSIDLLWLYALWTPVNLIATLGPAGLQRLPLELVAPGTPLWYIAGLAALNAGLVFLRRIRPAWPLAISAAAALGIATGHRTGIVGYDQFLHFAFFFFVGYYGRDRIMALMARCDGRTAIAAAAALTTMLTAPVPHSIASIVAGLSILPIAQGLRRVRGAALLASFGRRTLDVYLLHCPLLWIASRALAPYGAGTIALLTVAVIATCLALRTLAERLGLGWLYRRPAISLPVPARLRPLIVAGG